MRPSRNSRQEHSAMVVASRVAVVAGKFLVAALTSACVFVSAFGQTQHTHNDAWLEKSRAIHEHATKMHETPAWLRTQPDPHTDALVREMLRNTPQADARTEESVRQAIGETTLGELPSLAGANEPQARGPDTYLFISTSLPRDELSGLIVASQHEGVVAVLRGVLPGQSLGESLWWLREIVQQHDDELKPSVVIDPQLYRRYQVEEVPTVVHVPVQGNPVRARGAVTVDWIRSRANQGHDEGDTGPDDIVDLGAYGTTRTIAEKDLIEDIGERFAAIDWAAKREAAVADYWTRHADIVDLPPATVAREHTVDPTVVVRQDVYGPNGQLLAIAGQRLNPGALLPLTHTILVFDGTQPAQVDAMATIAAGVRAQNRGVIFITSRVDTALGWKAVHKIEQMLDAPVHVLQREVVDRLQLQRVPSVIEASGQMLRVREIPVETRLGQTIDGGRLRSTLERGLEFLVSTAQGADTLTCPDAGVIESFMTNVCWDCIFPIRIAGTDIGPGRAPPSAA
ncbi:MAG: TrbC family F-type conjugative pilus assembly protein, partial [Gammaproteobacteria bacterium]